MTYRVVALTSDPMLGGGFRRVEGVNFPQMFLFKTVIALVFVTSRDAFWEVVSVITLFNE